MITNQKHRAPVNRAVLLVGLEQPTTPRQNARCRVMGPDPRDRCLSFIEPSSLCAKQVSQYEARPGIPGSWEGVDEGVFRTQASVLAELVDPDHPGPADKAPYRVLRSVYADSVLDVFGCLSEGFDRTQPAGQDSDGPPRIFS